MYDVIVVGARVAGSPTAMLLARKGYKVLLVDRATFPSDTLSTHQVQLRGASMLDRWGLLNKVMASSCPPVEKTTFSINNLSMRGNFPSLDGTTAIVCPRRTILDKILLDAALEAGAELREDFLVEGLTYQGDAVSGIEGRTKSGPMNNLNSMQEHARLVIGADGKHSLVAKLVNGRKYQEKPVLTCAYYTYLEGIRMEGGEIYTLPQSVVGVWPTNDDLTIIYTAYPITTFNEIRKNIESSFWQTIDSIPALSERVHTGWQAEKFYGTADLPAFYRQSFGPGWALAGDAGLTMDPITGQGIGNAFHDAERLTIAIDAVFSGRTGPKEAYTHYEERRKAETLPMYEFTAQLAAFLPPSVEQLELFSAMAHKPEAFSRFLGMLTGSVRVEEFFSPLNLVGIIGLRGLSRVISSKLSSRRDPTRYPAARIN